MMGGSTTGRYKLGWMMCVVISQLLLSRIATARSAEVLGKFYTVLCLYNE